MIPKDKLPGNAAELRASEFPGLTAGQVVALAVQAGADRLACITRWHVSPGQVRLMRVVRKRAPEAFAALAAGEITLKEAWRRQEAATEAAGLGEATPSVEDTFRAAGPVASVAPGDDGLFLPPFATRTSLDLPPGLGIGRWLAFARGLQLLGASVSWWIGDAFRYGFDLYGEEASQAAEELGLAEHTLQNAISVCRAFPRERRREALSFAHHEAAAGLPAEDADRLLLWCEDPLREGMPRPRPRSELRRRIAEERAAREDAADVEVAREALAEVGAHPERLVRGPELERRLGEIMAADDAGPEEAGPVDGLPGQGVLAIEAAIEAWLAEGRKIVALIRRGGGVIGDAYADAATVNDLSWLLSVLDETAAIPAADAA